VNGFERYVRNPREVQRLSASAIPSSHGQNDSMWHLLDEDDEGKDFVIGISDADVNSPRGFNGDGGEKK
jgi:hypothetical protein